MKIATEELRKLVSEATPGPWTPMQAMCETWRGQGERNTRPIDFGYIAPICSTFRRPAGSDADECRIAGWANVRLAASAPTLAAELITARETLEEWKASQHYSYIGADGKTVKARDLEDELVTARAKLEAAEKLADAAENLGIAVSMGWDVDGVVANLRSALTAWEAAQ